MIIPTGTVNGKRRLGKYLGIVDGRPAYVGTVCNGTNDRKLAKDSGLILDGRRVFISAECKENDPHFLRATAKRIGVKDGREVYVGTCCPEGGECCADSPVPDTLTGTVTAYGWILVDGNPTQVLIGSAPITVTKHICLDDPILETGGEMYWTGETYLASCPGGSSGSGGSNNIGVMFACTHIQTSPIGTKAWYGWATDDLVFHPLEPCDFFTNGLNAANLSGRVPAEVTCDPLCIKFTSSHSPPAFDGSCQTFVFEFGLGCPGSSGGGVNTAACPNAISNVIGGSLAVTSGSAPALDGSTYSLSYLGNFGGVDVWRGTITVSGHLIYIDHSIGADGIPHTFIFGAEADCLSASGDTTSFDCGPPYRTIAAFTTDSGDACWPGISFTLNFGE